LSAVSGNVSWVAVLNVSPLVGEKDFSGLVVHVGKAVVDFGQLVGWEIGDEVLTRIDGPVDVEDTRLVLHATTVADITWVSMLVVMNGRSSLSQRGQREKSGSVRDTHFEMRGRLVAKKFKQEVEGKLAGCASDD
jgi:hypothetical protein